MDNSIPVSKSTASLAIIIPFLYNISIKEPHLLKKVLLLLQQKEDMSLSIFGNHVFILTKYANIKKIIPFIFKSSAHKLTLALIIITTCDYNFRVNIIKNSKIILKNEQNANTYRTCTKNSFKLSDITFIDRLNIQHSTFNLSFILSSFHLFFFIDLKSLEIFPDTGKFQPSLS